MTHTVLAHLPVSQGTKSLPPATTKFPLQKDITRIHTQQQRDQRMIRHQELSSSFHCHAKAVSLVSRQSPCWNNKSASFAAIQRLLKAWEKV